MEKTVNHKIYLTTGMGALLAIFSTLASADGGKLLLDSELDSVNAGSANAVAVAVAAGGGPNAIGLANTQTYASSNFVGGTGVTGAGAGAGAGGNAGAATGAASSVAPTPYGTSGNVSQTITSGGVTISSSVSNSTGVYLP